MADIANFAATPKVGAASFAGASSAPADLFTAGANGSRVDFVTICSAATTVDGTAEMFVFDGSNDFLVKTLPIPATTISAGSVSGFNVQVGLGMILPSGYKLRCAATLGANTLKFVAFGGDF